MGLITLHRLARSDYQLLKASPSSSIYILYIYFAFILENATAAVYLSARRKSAADVKRRDQTDDQRHSF